MFNNIHDNTGTATDRGIGAGLRIFDVSAKVVIEVNSIMRNIFNGDKLQGGGIDVGRSRR